MENELVSVVNNEIVVSSRDVAEHFGKAHKHVLDSIREILAAQNCAARFFHEHSYENRGKQYPEYLMNRDGCAPLVMGFTGKKALEWKLKYIEAFDSMEEQLKSLAPADRYMIADPIERAKAWIKEEEHRIALATEVKELEPKTRFA
ncbi:MAG: Rha family transcriptional regulator [Selenomonas sp.]|uniref:Rha family transcriptional regulator n=1 Tax=Selenomonas sp. TaxID=2053611 RepID=UPI0025EEF53F|nr:Rha family transcriptional regulator [Selenomonas sp.]MCR5757592.1 Rha family transcriptional regulator [Selenomonas sp.]